MRIYSCRNCGRILTEWEMKYKFWKDQEGGRLQSCTCGSLRFTGASPTFWYLVRTLQVFRVYYHAWRWRYAEQSKTN